MGDTHETHEELYDLAHANKEWDKIVQYIVHHSQDFFAIVPGRSWSIAHQVVYHGKYNHLHRMLEHLSDQININTKSNDNKTLYDVALKRQKRYPNMYQYIKRLFIQDELIQKAKQCQWQQVMELLNQNDGLANEKPPYSSYFLLHYIVEKGNIEILQNFLDHHEFNIEILDRDGSTPMDIAIRLKKDDIYEMLASRQHTESDSPLDQSLTSSISTSEEPTIPPSPRASHSDELNWETNSYQSSISSNQTSEHQSTTSILTVTKGKSNSDNANIILVNSTMDSSSSGNSPILVNEDFESNSPNKRQKMPRMIITKSIISTNSTDDSTSFEESSPLIVTPRKALSQSTTTAAVTTASSSPQPITTTELPAQQTKIKSSKLTREQVFKLLSCPLTKEIFVDPVIAADGRTYERSAITQWFSETCTSPVTQIPILRSLQDDLETKDALEAIQRLWVRLNNFH